MDIQQQLQKLEQRIAELENSEVWNGMSPDTRQNIGDCVIDSVTENIYQAKFIFKNKIYPFPIMDNSGNLNIAGTGTFGNGLAVTGTINITNGGIQIRSKGSAYRIGWVSGSGASVTQITNRSTAVTIDAYTGQITTRNDSLAAGASATFTVNNAFCVGSYVPVLAVQSQGTANTSIPLITAVTGTGFDITMYNRSASTADTGASIINFVLMAGASS